MALQIGNALVAADVNFKLVMGLRKSLMDKLDFEKLPAGASKMRAIEVRCCAPFHSLIVPVD